MKESILDKQQDLALILLKESQMFIQLQLKKQQFTDVVNHMLKLYKFNYQYLESYYGHMGPIYKVRCNPFWSDIFLTCSSDWSCKLWNWKSENPLNTF